MSTTTLEHVILSPGNSPENFAKLKRVDSSVEIQARRAGNPLDELEPQTSPESMQRQWYYLSDVPAYFMRNGDHILELHNLNDEEHFPDKADFVRAVKSQGFTTSKLPDLEDKTKVINLSDKKFGEHVTKDGDSGYSHITFKLSDVVLGKNHFEEVYGTEATKLFTAKHGENVYSTEGIKGRFRENQNTTNIYFQDQSVTEARLRGQEGAKVLRGACLSRLVNDSNVNLDDRFNNGLAHVSGVVEKTGAAGAPEKVDSIQQPVYTREGILDFLLTNPVSDRTFAAGLLKAANEFYQTQK